MKKRNKRKKSMELKDLFVIMIVLLLLIGGFLGAKKVFGVFNTRKDMDSKKVNSLLPSIYDEDLITKEYRDKMEEERVLQAEKIINEEREQIRLDRMLNSGKKYAFLTFDDGPSHNVTPRILDILDEYNIKASFFVVGTKVEANPEILIRAYESGHLIGNHSYSHDYNYIYANSDNYMEDLEKANDIIEGVIGNGFRPNIIRFPGGSFGDGKAPMREAVVNNGYRFFDWNSLNGDSEALSNSPASLVNRLAETTSGKRIAVILMHDAEAKMTTADSLRNSIEYLLNQGYEFKTLDEY